MNIVLWILQVLLALVFGMAGSMKILRSPDELTEQSESMAWTKETPLALVKFIGISEVAGALGLLLPAITGIAVDLVSLAGIGLAIVMILAGIFHFTRKEYQGVAFNMVLLALAIFVAYGRIELAIL